MSSNVNIVTVAIPAQDDTVLIAKAPDSNKGGGIRVVSAYAVNHAATSSTIGFAVELVKLSGAGTPALNGTVATSRGGTTDHWADAVPKALTLSDDTVAAGEWIGLKFTTTNAGTPTLGHVVVQYQMGA